MEKSLKNKNINGYTLTRNWYNFKFDNPSKTNARHSDMYFYIVDLWNRIGQKDEFGLPTFITMEALGIGSYNTYKKTLNDLINFGFIDLIQESKNQFKSKIIALSKNDKALNKTLDKALNNALAEALDKPPDNIIEQQTINDKEQTTNRENSLFPQNKNSEIAFLKFWNEYHRITKKPKTDKEATEKNWKKLTKLEKEKALFFIYQYSQTQEENRFLKKARNYLSEKNFNDEFVKHENYGYKTGNNKNKKGATIEELAQITHKHFGK